MGSRNRELVKSYNVKNIKELGIKYGMSRQNVKLILKQEGVL